MSKKQSDYTNCELNPTEVNDYPWLLEENSEITELYGEENEVGKWMIFYPKEELDSMWCEIKTIYNNKLLEGVTKIKVSTNHNTIYEDEGVILFYCNNSYNEDFIMEIGGNILDKLNYSPYDDTRYIYYKLDYQSKVGNRNTGQTKNYIYRLKI